MAIPVLTVQALSQAPEKGMTDRKGRDAIGNQQAAARRRIMEGT
jgi:hypothetical protein